VGIERIELTNLLSKKKKFQNRTINV
jgi:hypothetical protein